MGRAKRLFGKMHASSEGQGTTVFAFVTFFQMSFEGGVHFLEPLLCRQLAASGETLIAI
jgi:hypothetical protein